MVLTISFVPDQELRTEDYLANRKGKQAGAATGFGFTQPTATAQPAGLFGQQKTGFGATSESLSILFPLLFCNTSEITTCP